MEHKHETIFREKNLKRATDSEKLDGYLKVTGIGPWLAVLTAAAILAAIAIWMVFGKVQTKITGAGYCENGTITCYFVLNDITKLSEGDTVDIESISVEDAEGTVTKIDSSLYRSSDIPNEILFLLEDAEWYGTVEVSCEEEDALYAVSYTEESSAMASFVNQED